MNDLKAKLNKVGSRIEAACQKSGRDPASVRLLAVSKRHTANKIRQLNELGQRHFGENYVQEAREKQQQLGDLSIEWHFIGPLQSNKTREVAEHFQWVQSVDREKLLRRLSAQRSPDLPLLNVCLQVNIDLEPQKSGANPSELSDLARLTSELPGLRLRGLMAIPQVSPNGRPDMASFVKLRDLFVELQEQGHEIDTLSMGMSSDLEDAIACGSTMVRIGTDLFGPRN